jgi:altronate hydrolase
MKAMRNGTLQLHPRDTVAVALTALKAGSSVRLENCELVIKQDIPAAHKVALRLIRTGETIVKYGSPIGTAKTAIEPGHWVHNHNLVSRLQGVAEYQYNPTAAKSRQTGSSHRSLTFMGYKRSDGRVGIRNDLWILPTVGCANGPAGTMAARFRLEMPAGIDGVRVLSHPYGCSQSGEDHRRTRGMLAAMAVHPNAGAILVLGLGCEDNCIEEFRPEIEKLQPRMDPRRIHFLEAQREKEEIDAGVEALRRLGNFASACERTPLPLSQLALGMKCGGSDAFSGISANPLVGEIADRLYDCGASTVLTEVPEMFGAEQHLLDRCSDRQVFTRATTMLNKYRRMFIDHGQPIYENPSFGNREGGITTLEEKSLGCVQKGGSQPVVDVLSYGHLLRKPGLSLAEGPGNDLVAVSVLAATGVQMILFTTGRGTPLGSPVPVIKIASNSDLTARKPHWIDFDAGGLIQGASLSEEADRLLQLVVDVASGRQTRNEENGYHDFLPFKDGTTE